MSESSSKRPLGSFNASLSSVPGTRPYTPSDGTQLHPHDSARASPSSCISTEADSAVKTKSPTSGIKKDSLTAKDSNSPGDRGRKHLSKTGGFLLGSKRRRLQNSPSVARFSPEPQLDGHLGSRTGAIEHIGRDREQTPDRNESLDYGRSLSGSLPSIKAKDRVSSGASQATSSAAAFSEGWPSDIQDGSHDRDESSRPAIDAQQLVRMALSLSESRRLHLEPGQLVASNAASGQRRPSSGVRPLSRGEVQSPTYPKQPQDFSLSQPGGSYGRQPRQRDRLPSASAAFQPENDAVIPFPFLSEYEYKISPASRARAEKARAYIELSNDYFQLLELLPPLRPGISASQRHENPRGRTYNPLQNIRNRKARARERKVVDADAAGWNDPERLHAWLDKVKQEAQRPDFLQGDIVMLPPWESPSEDNALEVKRADGSHPVEGSKSRTKRQAIDWVVTKAELLADAYWLEQADHKALIESHDGKKIYTKVFLPVVDRRSTQDQDSDDSPIEDSENIQSSPISPAGRQGGIQEQDHADMTDHRPFSSHKGAGIISSMRPRRHFLGRHRANTSTSSDESGSDKDRRHKDNIRTKIRQIPENTAPLERHMNKLMEREGQQQRHKQTRPSVSRLNSQDSTTGRRMGISEEPHRRASRSTSLSRMHTIEDALRQKEDGKHNDTNETSLLPAARVSNGDLSKAPTRVHTDGERVRDSPTTKTKHSHLGKLGFGRRRRAGTGSQESATSSEDEATAKSNRDAYDYQGLKSKPRHHRKETRRDGEKSGAKTEKRNDTGNGNIHLKHPDDRPDEATAQKRLFKSSRIGDTAKKMMPLPSDKLLRDTKTWVESAASSRSRLALDSSKDEGSADEAKPRKGRFSIDQLRPPSAPTRARSATDLNRRGREGQYHMQNLPSFTSQSGGKKRGDSPIKRAISPTKRGGFFERSNATPSPKQSRLSQLQGAMRAGTKSENVSPSASVSDFREDNWQNHTTPLKDQLRNSPFNPFKQDSFRGRHLQPDHRGKKDADREVSPRMQSTSPNPHHWSIAGDRRVSTTTAKPPQTFPVSAADIAYTRALLLSCGTKASAILAKASSTRSHPSAFLTKAYQLNNQNVAPVARKEEHVVAARMLSSHLEKSVSSFECKAREFKSSTASQLAERISDLRDLVGTRLTNRVRDGCDNADSFVAELTQNRTLAVKKVNDSIDEMLRSRRQRLRWVSRAGFAGLEYMLVAILWGIWGIVFMLRIIRYILLGWLYVLQWLLFLR